MTAAVSLQPATSVSHSDVLDAAERLLTVEDPFVKVALAEFTEMQRYILGDHRHIDGAKLTDLCSQSRGIARILARTHTTLELTKPGDLASFTDALVEAMSLRPKPRLRQLHH